MSARTIQGKLAAESRHRPNEDHTELRRAFVAAKLEEYIAKVVAEAPPLTAEQRDRLALLLRAGAPPGRAAHEEPTPAANPEGGSHLPRTGTEGQVHAGGDAA